MDRRLGGLVAGVGCLALLLLAAAVVFVGALIFRGTAFLPSTGDPTPRVRDGSPAPNAVETEREREAVSLPDIIVQEEPETLNDIYELVNPGVVSIQVQVVQRGQSGIAAGSGFVITEDGYIATNFHVVQGAELVFVTFFNNVQAPAEVIGLDANSDLAIIKVESLPPEVHPLALGDSDQVLVGDRVVALGNPFSLANTMTYGIVSAVGRLIPAPVAGAGGARFDIPQAIQTDAAINPGNSGGPLVNMNGQVIGVNAQIQTGGTSLGNVGIGFAIPINILDLVAPSLIADGSYTWPWLGVSGTDVNQTIREANGLEDQQGAYIVQVVSGGPAADAGLQGARDERDVQRIPVPVGGDVVVEANGQPVRSFSDLLNIVAFLQPGDTIPLTVLRDGEQIQVDVTLEPRPQGQESFPAFPGFP